MPVHVDSGSHGDKTAEPYNLQKVTILGFPLICTVIHCGASHQHAANKFAGERSLPSLTPVPGKGLNSNLSHAKCVTRCECRCPRHLRRVFGASRASATKRLWSCRRRRLRRQCRQRMTASSAGSSQIYADQCLRSLDGCQHPWPGSQPLLQHSIHLVAGSFTHQPQKAKNDGV